MYKLVAASYERAQKYECSLAGARGGEAQLDIVYAKTVSVGWRPVY